MTNPRNTIIQKSLRNVGRNFKQIIGKFSAINFFRKIVKNFQNLGNFTKIFEEMYTNFLQISVAGKKKLGKISRKLYTCFG